MDGTCHGTWPQRHSTTRLALATDLVHTSLLSPSSLLRPTPPLPLLSPLPSPFSLSLSLSLSTLHPHQHTRSQFQFQTTNCHTTGHGLASRVAVMTHCIL